MRIGIFGSGIVARTLGTRLATLGHEVRLGSRAPHNPVAARWAGETGRLTSHGTFAETAAFGELLFNCTAGVGSLEALAAAERNALAGKILIDVANPLDFSRGVPPSFSVCNTDSLGEQIQRAHPELRVVKALNTVNCDVMADPGIVPGEHDLLICGDDPEAKLTVKQLLMEWFGWRQFIDLGDISAARGTEMYLALWVRLWGAFGTPHLNVHVHRAAAVPGLPSSDRARAAAH